MTDRAHYLVPFHQSTVSELIQMAANTRVVGGELQIERAALALMAGRTFELFMLRDFVRKRLEGFVRCLYGYRFRRLGSGKPYRCFG